MVLYNGRALALGEAEPLCNAILEAWYPGRSASIVVVKALTGAINPGGKLTVTVPQISSQCPIYYGTKTDAAYTTIKQEPAKDVMQPLYPFGYGLSYTTFSIHDLVVDEQVAVGDAFTVQVKVTNTGEVAGDETVQIYTHSVCLAINRPIKELRAWKRVALEPGETKTVTFTLDTRQFGYMNAEDEFVVEARPQDVFACSDSSTIVERAPFRVRRRPAGASAKGSPQASKPQLTQCEETMNTPGSVYTGQLCLHGEDSASTACVLKGCDMGCARRGLREEPQTTRYARRCGPLGAGARGACGSQDH